MKLTDIDLDALRAAVNDMPTHFHTKDVSRHSKMEKIHVNYLNEKQYHSLVGKRLRASSGLVKIIRERDHPDKGALWKKTNNVE